jgi:hypothetical protein
MEQENAMSLFHKHRWKVLTSEGYRERNGTGASWTYVGLVCVDCGATERHDINFDATSLAALQEIAKANKWEIQTPAAHP